MLAKEHLFCWFGVFCKELFKMAACHFILKVSSTVEKREWFDDLVACDCLCACVCVL